MKEVVLLDLKSSVLIWALVVVIVIAIALGIYVGYKERGVNVLKEQCIGSGGTPVPMNGEIRCFDLQNRDLK